MHFQVNRVRPIGWSIYLVNADTDTEISVSTNKISVSAKIWAKYLLNKGVGIGGQFVNALCIGIGGNIDLDNLLVSVLARPILF